MKENEFKTVPKEVLLIGAKECLDNGKSLYDNAKSIGKMKHYGLACSLLVLSVEECVKSVILLAGFFNVDAPNNVSHFFRYHKSKHEQAAEMQSLFNSIHGVIDSFKKMIAESKNVALNMGVLLLLHGVLDKFLNPKLDLKKWWKEADDLKKAGFYVDYLKDGWQTPSLIDSTTFERTLNIARPFVETLEVIRQLRPEDYKAFV